FFLLDSKVSTTFEPTRLLHCNLSFFKFYSAASRRKILGRARHYWAKRPIMTRSPQDFSPRSGGIKFKET
ncbi:MAG: hypothetical protein AAF806_18365, partial [Bacteroidota bacterium]